MELGKIKNLLEPENARYIPLVTYGLVRGLARMALHEIFPPKQSEHAEQARIEYYSTDEPKQ